MRRVQQDSLRLEAALAGDRKAFGHVLDVAYGRKGKLKWEILQVRSLVICILLYLTYTFIAFTFRPSGTCPRPNHPRSGEVSTTCLLT